MSSSESLENNETIKRIQQNTLLYPVMKAFLSAYPPEHDILNTYDQALSHIPKILETESRIDGDFIDTAVNNVSMRIWIHASNVKFFDAKSVQFHQYASNAAKASSPLEAMKNRTTYSCLLIADMNISWQLIKTESGYTNTDKSKMITITLPNSYYVDIPIPIGSKYCTTRQYDQLTLMRTGQDFDGINGYFIIGGFPKYLIPYYEKPFNCPMIRKNNYENQLSRCEVLYSGGLDYENSHYLLASCVKPTQTHFGRGVNKIIIPDFIFALHFDDYRMNRKLEITRKKSLFNKVPIKYLFYAFGCKSDLEMIHYIDPNMNDYGLIHAIRSACLQGFEHIDVLKNVIPYMIENESLILKKSMDYSTSRYLIGTIILSEEYKKRVINRCNNDNVRYRKQIIKDVDEILLKCFMPGIGRLEAGMPLYIKIKKLDSNDEESHKEFEKFLQDRNRAICIELGNIVRKLYKIGNDIEVSMDRISLLNKRIRSGQQIEHEFKGFNNQRLREIEQAIKFKVMEYKSYQNLNSDTFKTDLTNMLTSKIKEASTQQSLSLLNAFKSQINDRTKMRTNLLTPKNQGFLYNNLREVVISSDSKKHGAGVTWEHRVVHPSHYFFIDPVHSPESGPQVGRYQMPTPYSFLTSGSLGEDIFKLIKTDPYYQHSTDNTFDYYTIKLNGSIIGYIDQFKPVENLYEKLIDAKAKKEIEFDCTITLKHNEGVLDIWTDEGRLNSCFVNVSKCFDIKNNQIEVKKEFKDWLERLDHEPNLLIEGFAKRYIELLTPDMVVFNATIADNPSQFYANPKQYSHIGLPEGLLSYVTALNPCVANNSAIRASYSSNHMKQAIGCTFRYPQLCYLNDDNVPLAAQVPLVRTAIYDALGLNHKPMGCNIIIAYLVYTDNQEDSFILNRSSVENGLFVIDSVATMSTQCEKLEEEFRIPTSDMKKNGTVDSYSKLDEQSCLPKNIGDKFYLNDALIAKTVKLPEGKFMDTSILNDRPDAMHPLEANTRELRYVVNDFDVNHNNRFKSAVFCQRRVAVAGDKFNSCHAQKSTVGRIYNSTEMPYTQSGIKPDIIFNPPTIFKRNTLGQIYESVASKLACLTGCPIDATPYATLRTVEELENIYNKLKLDPTGYETLYDPKSGRKIGKVFVATIQEQRQQHLVENKLNVRCADGDYDKVFGIPVKGRKRSGGQSVDRMSNDAIICSGSMRLNKDLHLRQGAHMTIAICNVCHKQFTYFSPDYQAWVCMRCGRHQDFTIKEVVPAENLINQVLTGMHVCFEFVNNREGNKNVIKAAQIATL